jgi:hypothetical protein
MFFSCEDQLEPAFVSGGGIEFYLTNNTISTNASYSSYVAIQVDTLSIENEPFITYDDILLYDSANYTYTLRFSKYSESFSELYKEPNSFVISLDGEPIMYGYFWSLIRSQSCPCVYLLEPLENLNSDNSNEIKLYFGYPSAEFAMGNDPRNDPRLIERLKRDGKLKLN